MKLKKFNNDELKELFAKNKHRLSEKHRDMYSKYLNGIPCADIAREYNISSECIRQYINKCIERTQDNEFVDINMPTRIWRCLYRNRINTIADLKKNIYNLKSVKGIGKGTVNEIKELLRKQENKE